MTAPTVVQGFFRGARNKFASGDYLTRDIELGRKLVLPLGAEQFGSEQSGSLPTRFRAISSLATVPPICCRDDIVSEQGNWEASAKGNDVLDCDERIKRSFRGITDLKSSRFQSR